MFDVEGELYDVPVCVERIIRSEPRPVLLVPPERNGRGDPTMTGPVLIAFDGSPAASRALHMFALLGTLDNLSQSKQLLRQTGLQAPLSAWRVGEPGHRSRRPGGRHAVRDDLGARQFPFRSI